jgi:hypothetical protein
MGFQTICAIKLASRVSDPDPYVIRILKTLDPDPDPNPHIDLDPKVFFYLFHVKNLQIFWEEIKP